MTATIRRSSDPYPGPKAAGLGKNCHREAGGYKTAPAVCMAGGLEMC